MSLHYRWKGEDVILKVIVKPNAKQTKIVGLYNDELKIHLAAVPEKGKANSKLCEFIADCLKLSKSQVKVLRGETSQHKEILIIQPITSNTHPLLNFISG